MNADALCEALRASRGFAHKRDIADVMRRLSPVLPAGATPEGVRVGDDCAALPDGDGHLLFAIEGFVEDFVLREPWFAGWCGLMVNLSDVAAMGGRPIAVVDALWSDGAAQGAPVLDGLAEASRRYGVPLVGGHSNQRSARPQLAVAVLGRARRLLTSFDARPGDVLLAAIDLRGRWHDPWPYWDAATSAPAERLRGDLALLPTIAEAGLCDAAKDISMAGVVGTALMLLECSGVGARLDLGGLPRPEGLTDADDAGWLRWLTAFPSFGFLLSVAPSQVVAVQHHFAARGIGCGAIGDVRAGPEVSLRHRGTEALLWHLGEQPFITAGHGHG
jgi:AIR synthase-related protein